jgi:DME family drug/metabolite transporter
LLVLLPCILWSTTGTVASFLPPGVNPLAIGAWEQGIGGLLYFATRARSSLRALLARETRYWVVLGAVGIAVSTLIYFPSLALGGVALGTTVTLGSAPVFAAIVERLFDGVRLSWRWMVGTALSIGGIAALAFGSERVTGGPVAGNLLLALVFGLVAGLGYAVYAFAARKAMAAGAASDAAMGGMFLGCSFALVPIFAATGLPLLETGTGVGVAAYLAIFPLFLGYAMFAKGLALVSASFALTVTLAEPGIAALLAVLVVGEHISVPGWLGVAVIAAGILLASLPSPSSGEGRISDIPA